MKYHKLRDLFRIGEITKLIYHKSINDIDSIFYCLTINLIMNIEIRYCTPRSSGTTTQTGTTVTYPSLLGSDARKTSKALKENKNPIPRNLRRSPRHSKPVETFAEVQARRKIMISNYVAKLSGSSTRYIEANASFKIVSDSTAPKEPPNTKAPTAPTAPTAPKAPTAPSVPKAPTAPSVPKAPTAPTAPKAPTAPSVPKAPTAPKDPPNNKAPTALTAPEEPKYISMKEFNDYFSGRVAPTAPSVPKAPTAPSVPKAPTAPSVPKAPTAPTAPSVPKAPTAPTAPSVPKAPTAPTAPSVPKAPTAPSVPKAPTAPTAPSVPKAPTAPTAPSVPKAPTAPTAPSVPKAPTAHVNIPCHDSSSLPQNVSMELLDKALAFNPKDKGPIAQKCTGCPSEDDEDGDDDSTDTMQHVPDGSMERTPKVFVKPTEIPNIMTNLDPFPKKTKETERIASFFKNLSRKAPFSKILRLLKKAGLERAPIQLTPIIAEHMKQMGTWIHDEEWFSLSRLGISSAAISSYGRLYYIGARYLSIMKREKGGNLRYRIQFDDGVTRNMRSYNLVAGTFLEFPTRKHMTVDHFDRRHSNDHISNLSWETRRTQVLNRNLSKRTDQIKVCKYDATTEQLLCVYDSAKCAAIAYHERSDVTETEVNRFRLACKKGTVLYGHIWRYYIIPLLPGEEFRSIPIDGLRSYEVSNKGRVRYPTGRITLGSLRVDDYRVVSFTNDITGEHRGYLVHVIAAITWIPNPNPAQFDRVNHIDEKRGNNDVENLEWTDHDGNMRHAYKGNHANKTPVTLYCFGVNTAQYSSIAEAIEAYGCDGYTWGVINRMCLNQLDHSAPIFFQHTDPNYTPSKDGSGRATPVVQCDKKWNVLQIWRSESQANAYTGISGATISRCVKKRHLCRHGYRFRRLNALEAPWPVPNSVDHLIMKAVGQRDNDEVVVFHEREDGSVWGPYPYGKPYPASIELHITYRNVLELCNGNCTIRSPNFRKYFGGRPHLYWLEDYNRMADTGTFTLRPPLK